MNVGKQEKPLTVMPQLSPSSRNFTDQMDKIVSKPNQIFSQVLCRTHFALRFRCQLGLCQIFKSKVTQSSKKPFCSLVCAKTSQTGPHTCHQHVLKSPAITFNWFSIPQCTRPRARQKNVFVLWFRFQSSDKIICTNLVISPRPRRHLKICSPTRTTWLPWDGWRWPLDVAVVHPYQMGPAGADGGPLRNFASRAFIKVDDGWVFPRWCVLGDKR